MVGRYTPDDDSDPDDKIYRGLLDRSDLTHPTPTGQLKQTLLKGFAIVFLSSAVNIGMVVLSLQYGWGLEAKSWAWIIGAGFFGVLFSKLILLMDEEG